MRAGFDFSSHDIFILVFYCFFVCAVKWFFFIFVYSLKIWRQPSALSIAQSAGVCWVPTGMGWMDMDGLDEYGWI